MSDLSQWLKRDKGPHTAILVAAGLVALGAWTLGPAVGLAVSGLCVWYLAREIYPER